MIMKPPQFPAVVGRRPSRSSLSLLAVTVAIWRSQDCPGEHLATVVNGDARGAGCLVGVVWAMVRVRKVSWPGSVGLQVMIRGGSRRVSHSVRRRLARGCR
jgi:hypothetical protein